MAGGMLRLHPKIVVEHGKMDASKKYRGKLASVITAYAKDLEPQLLTARPERVFITHSGCDRKSLIRYGRISMKPWRFEEILETRVQAV